MEIVTKINVVKSSVFCILCHDYLNVRIKTTGRFTMRISDSILLESKSARDRGLSEIELRESQQNLLGRVKPVFFAVWRGTGYLSLKQVAEFYEVSSETVKKNFQRTRSEFIADGVKVPRGQSLKEVRDIMSLTSSSPSATIFPPRAVMRMGFILQDSEVAAQVRTAALNLIQGVSELFEDGILEALLANQPILAPIVNGGQLSISSPLSQHYSAIERGLRRSYPDGGIKGMHKNDIRDRLAALSTYTQNWKLESQKELAYRLKNSRRAKYPDLTSNVIEISVDGQSKSAVLLFHISDLVVDQTDVEAAVGRQYVKRAKDHFSVDYAFLFLIAPFGATPAAQDAILKDLPTDMRGFFGVMTVKELAQILRDQAWSERKHGILKGEINTNFKDILEYEIPVSPLLIMMQYQMPLFAS